MRYDRKSLEQTEEVLLKIIKDESINYFKKNEKFERYSKLYFEDLNKEKLQTIYYQPEFVGWWNYMDDVHNLFSLKEIYREKDKVSGIILDKGGIALVKGKIKICKDDWIRSINIKKKYLKIFKHKNTYLMKGENSLLIPEYQHKLIGKVYIKDMEKAEFGIERPKENKTLEKMVYNIYVNALSQIK